MVIPCGIQAVGAAGSAGATVLGLGMGKTDLELSQELFKQQMRQTKRLWTADWAESSLRHGEQTLQAAQQHAEAQAMSTASYFQAEKLASQGLKLARDQDSRSYEMSWRAEVRESLRDELSNQNNRFNIVMLCDTVCLGCVFTLVADGSPPVETSVAMLNAYVFCLGVSIMLFSISLWGSVIVVRRLHDHTAGRLERKLFAQSEDLQKIWRYQLANNIPTGTQEMYLVNQAYEKWVDEHVDPIGRMAVQMLSIGVVMMFITAGLLVHNQYLIQYKAPLSVPFIFWSFVFITSVTVILMKDNEDRIEKRKEGVYDISWQDENTEATGPFAKISKAVEEITRPAATNLASQDRAESFGRQERKERDYCVKTQSLTQRVESLRKESDNRTRTRKEVLNILTTAAEELDALPEELTSRLNKMLHTIDETDARTADLVAMHSEVLLTQEGSQANLSRLRRWPPVAARKPMALHPIDAQRIPISLGSLRRKLGEIPMTTMIRVRNSTNEPLRLKSGVQLGEGKYIKSLNVNNPNESSVACHLYPVTEIPPRSEVIIAARSGGSAWVPTSGIKGEIVYTNRDESWNFKISFRNALIGNIRRCRVDAFPVSSGDDSVSLNMVDERYWQISKEELDRKANNELLVTIDCLQGEQAAVESTVKQNAQLILKKGVLSKRIASGLGLRWEPRVFELTPRDLNYRHVNGPAVHQTKISLDRIQKVSKGSDLVKKNIIDVQIADEKEGTHLLRLSASSEEDCEDWIQNIMVAASVNHNEGRSTIPNVEHPSPYTRSPSARRAAGDVRDINQSIECVRNEEGEEVLLEV